MDALASSSHIGLIYATNADGTDQIIEAKGEAYGTTSGRGPIGATPRTEGSAGSAGVDDIASRRSGGRLVVRGDPRPGDGRPLPHWHRSPRAAAARSRARRPGSSTGVHPPPFLGVLPASATRGVVSRLRVIAASRWFRRAGVSGLRSGPSTRSRRRCGTFCNGRGDRGELDAPGCATAVSCSVVTADRPRDAARGRGAPGASAGASSPDG